MFDRLRRFHLELDDKILLGVIVAVVVFSIVQAGRLPPYYLHFWSNILIFGIFGLAYNFLHGHIGLVSFGHAGFFVVGAYAGAMALEFSGYNAYLGFIACIVGSAIFALFVGFIAVRLRGIYFAIITLALSMIPYYLIRDTFVGLTWGVMGWHLRGVVPNFFFDLSNPRLLLFFSLGALIVVYIILRIIINSSYGQWLTCIKDNELKLEGLGYNTRRLKYIAVTISGTLSGVAGYLYLLNNSSIFPELGLVFYSAKVIFVSIMGGIGSIIGPLLGAYIWFCIEEFLVRPGSLEITLGIALLIVILRLPTGIIGLARTFKLKR